MCKRTETLFWSLPSLFTLHIIQSHSCFSCAHLKPSSHFSTIMQVRKEEEAEHREGGHFPKFTAQAVAGPGLSCSCDSSYNCTMHPPHVMWGGALPPYLPACRHASSVSTNTQPQEGWHLHIRFIDAHDPGPHHVPLMGTMGEKQTQPPVC